MVLLPSYGICNNHSLFGWLLNVNMSLQFDYLTIATFVAVLIANSICSDGRSNWLKELCYWALYAILAVSFGLLNYIS